MKAIVFKKPGPPSVLKTVELPPPSFSQKEVLIEIKAVSLNRLDILVRKGLTGTAPFPHIPGSDASGVVVATGKEVRKYKRGDPVVLYPGTFCSTCKNCKKGKENLCSQFKVHGFQIQGSYAQYLAVPEANLFPLPPHLSYEEGAAFPLVFLTAYHMLKSLGEISQGETLFIPSVSSGLGTALFQLAQHFQASITVSSSTQEKLKEAEKLGATSLVLNHSRAWKTFLQKNGQAFDIVVDHTGGERFLQHLSLLKKGGRFIFCGTTRGPEVLLPLRNVYVFERKLFGAYLGTRKELAQVCKILSEEKIKPVIAKTFPFQEAAQAHRYLESGTHFGKVVLKL